MGEPPRKHGNCSAGSVARVSMNQGGGVVLRRRIMSGLLLLRTLGQVNLWRRLRRWEPELQCLMISVVPWRKYGQGRPSTTRTVSVLSFYRLGKPKFYKF